MTGATGPIGPQGQIGPEGPEGPPGTTTADGITSGTLADEHLSSNVALLDAIQSFSGKNSFPGGVTLNGSDLQLKGPNDQNHGLGWHGGSAKPYAGETIGGPVLWGANGGALGAHQTGNNLENLALRWFEDQSVQALGSLSVNGNLSVDGSISGSLSAAQITSGTIDNNRISLTASEIPSLPASKITSGAFGSARIASGAVTDAKIAGVSASKLTGTIDNARISLTASEIPSLNASKITAGTFGSARIANNAITSAKIADGAVTEAKLANGAVTTDKIADGSIGNAKHAPLSIGGGKIKDLSITTDKLADQAVNNSKLGDLSVTAAKIANQAVKTAHIANGGITEGKLAPSIITTAKIANDAVTTDKIAINAVGNLELAPLAVGTGKIKDGAVTSAKIQDETISSNDLEETVRDGIWHPLYAVPTGSIDPIVEQVAMFTHANIGIGTGSTSQLNSGTKLRVDGKIRINDEARFDNGVKLGAGSDKDRFVIERGTHTINGNVNTVMKFRVPYASSHYNWEFANSSGSAYNVKMRLMRGGDLVLSGQLSTGSDRNSKTNIVSTTAAADLEKLVNLPIYEWSYIDQEDVRHVGPMAQDFHAQFQQLGEETRLPLGDLSGVTVSALQGLHAVVQAQKTEIDQLKIDLADLKAAVEALQAPAQ